MLLKALVEQLEADGLATFGVDLYAGDGYPFDAPDECFLLLDSGGPAPSKYLPVETQNIQVLTRALHYLTAKANSRTIFRYFHGEVTGNKWDPKHNYIIGTTEQFYVYSSEALQPPSSIGPDEKNRAEVSFNLSFQIRLKGSA